MEQLIATAKFPAKCVKNEIHNLLTTLRLTRHKSSHGPQAQFHYQALRSFQRLFEELTYINELHEFDTVAYLAPFLEVIQSDATDGQITAVTLDAVDKFVSFGLINPQSPRCMEAVNTLAWGVINCRFVSSGSANDEVVLLKIVGLLIDCLRCPAGEYLSDMCVWHMVRKCFQISRQPRASHLLRSSAESVLQQMVLTIFGTHKERARHIAVKGGTAAINAGTATPISPPPTAAAPLNDTAVVLPSDQPTPVQVYRPYGYRAMHYVMKFLAFLLAFGRGGPGGTGPGENKPRPRVRRQRSRSPSTGGGQPENSPMSYRSESRDRSPTGSVEPSSNDLGLSDNTAQNKMPADLITDTHCLGLSLLNVALESGGDEIARSDELICVIQDDICKSLLQNSRTESLSVLSLTLRAIFNLFLHFKRHLKVQLEIFFTSVHLKIAGLDAASYEQRELALESLLEFCREPELMLELYENYDCDVRCTNLFETLVRFLVSHAFPSDGVKGVRGGFNSLHRLALSGVLSILHSMAYRCGNNQRFRGDIGSDVGGEAQTAALPSHTPSSAAESELQRKKEQKRRLTIAAKTFNSGPSKSMGALQSLGLVSDPPTPESVAEFLRHTPGLELPLVGEYLSKRNDFNGQVRKAFMTLFGFQGMPLVEALRLCLSTFRLPGEAQLIERLMESFAENFYSNQLAAEAVEGSDPLKTPRWIPREKHNYDGMECVADGGDAGAGPEDAAGGEPSRVKMANSDTIFVLSYSIIMLNTDLHNPGVKNKMKVEEFIKNNRSIDNGANLPEFFLRDIYDVIRDDEIRLHGDAQPEGHEVVVDDFFWEGILKRSESIDEFSSTERLLSETAPGATERDMFQVTMDASPLPTLSLCYESVPDVYVAHQAMTGFQDLAKISFYYDQSDAVNSLVRVMCQYFSRASAAGSLPVRAQIALRAAQECVVSYSSLLREAEWRNVLDVLLQLWALDLLPPHLTEFDDFSGPDGKPLESLCNLKPPFTAPAPAPEATEAPVVGPERVMLEEKSPSRMYEPYPARGGRGETDGFLESLTRWLDDETRDGEEEPEAPDPRRSNFLDHNADIEGVSEGAFGAGINTVEGDLPVASSDPAAIHQQVKHYVARSGFVDLFTLNSLSRLPAESFQLLAKALVLLSRPPAWSSSKTGSDSSPTTASGTDSQPAANSAGASAEALGSQWHEVADPVFGLELLTNMTCMPLSQGQRGVSQIWPLVSTHFERLLQFVIAGGGAAEQQFIERLIVNTVRLCIRLIGNSELVATLLSLLQHLAKLPPALFAPYAERIACGLLVFVKMSNLPHSGLVAIFTLLKRTAEFQDSIGAGSAGIEIVNYWLNDDQELMRLLSLQQFPELLSTMKGFALQNNTPASATALNQLFSLVLKLARPRPAPQEAPCQWQTFWVPTLHAISNVALEGSQKSSAQAFVYLQSLLLERGTELSLPLEELPFSAWKECLEQVLFPLVQAPAEAPAAAKAGGDRQASAAQLLCRVVLTHLPDWETTSPEEFPALFLRLLHILVGEATAEGQSGHNEHLVESMRNLLLVISMDNVFSKLSAPQPGESLLEATWSVVTPSLPGLRREIALILDPSLAEQEATAAEESPAAAS